METSPSPVAPPRRGFALTGPSRPLDPRTNAVRRDLADIRLADRVFAPHYAEAVARTVLTTTPLRQDRDVNSPVLASLEPGDMFELLEITGDTGWGVAVAPGLVGYVDAEALSDSGKDG